MNDPHGLLQTTCTVAKALNVTFFGYSVWAEPRVLITGFNGCRGLADKRPADVAKSRILSVILDPVDGFGVGGAITCGSTVDGAMYLQWEKKL